MVVRMSFVSFYRICIRGAFRTLFNAEYDYSGYVYYGRLYYLIFATNGPKLTASKRANRFNRFDALRIQFIQCYQLMANILRVSYHRFPLYETYVLYGAQLFQTPMNDSLFTPQIVRQYTLDP